MSMAMSERIRLYTALAAHGNPMPLLNLYRSMATELGYAQASSIIQRYAIEVYPSYERITE